MRTIDRIFGWLMVAGALAHVIGLAFAVHIPAIALLRDLDAGFAQLLLGAVNLIRAERRHDLVLASVCVAGNLCWLVSTFTLAALRRPVAILPLSLQTLIVFALLLLSMRSRKRSRPM